MPDNDRLEAMQVMPATLGERLAMLVGQPVTVFLMGVHAEIMVAAPGPGVPCPPMMNLPPWCPPRPGPCPEPAPLPPPCPAPAPMPEMMGTAVVRGILVAVGPDFLAVRMGQNAACRDIIIPFNAVGMIVPMMLM